MQKFPLPLQKQLVLLQNQPETFFFPLIYPPVPRLVPQPHPLTGQIVLLTYLIRVSLLIHIYLYCHTLEFYVCGVFPHSLTFALSPEACRAGMTIGAYLDGSYCVHLLPNQDPGWAGEEEVGVLWRIWLLQSLWIDGSLRVVLQVAPETQPGSVVVQTPGESGWQSTKEQGIAVVGHQRWDTSGTNWSIVTNKRFWLIGRFQFK